VTAVRRLVVGLLGALGGCGVAAAVLVATPSTPLVAAADTSGFRAGNIISDQLFYDGGAMSAAEVQTFLDSKNPTCVAAKDGTPCLKNARQDTYTRPADSRCPGTYVGAANEAASTIIAKVGAACGISQRVLLVILQKEQGLVTLSGDKLNGTRYEKAMGYGCPDTAPCNPAYAHLFNQLYSAARQYRDYLVAPRTIKAGITNQIRFSPDPGCGSSAVFVENSATAGLYTYTPYQPNAAALAAGAGSGDACSAYGNRNFYIYFTDWFGSTQVPGASQVTGRYAAMGGSAGTLGGIQGSVVCGLTDGGCWQGYAKGAIYWSPNSGAHVVSNGAVRDRWAQMGWERSSLGYPVGDTTCGLAAAGCFQAFQSGSLYWSSATGAHTVAGAVRDKWGTAGWEGGSLGYPTSDQATTPNGQAQYTHFERGSIYWSQATAAHVLSGTVRDRWAASGWESGPLGLPVSDVASTPDGVARFAHFQNGSVYWTSGTGARLLLTPIRDRWAATGWESGTLGYPVADQVATPGGTGQVVGFQRGWLYWSQATGARLLAGPVRDAWLAAGADGGSLGLPVGDVGTTPDGKAQYGTFSGGSVYVHATLGSHVVPTAVRDGWAAAGWEGGPLGYPTSDAVATTDRRGQVMTFQGGQVYTSPATGGHAVTGTLLTGYLAAGGADGDLGLPVDDAGSTPDGKARYQNFEGGSLYVVGAGTYVVPLEVRAVWARSGWESGPLGYPTAAATVTGDAAAGTATTMQAFQGGTVYATAAGGAHAVSKAFQAALTTAGGAAVLGAPSSDVRTTPDGKATYQQFLNGAVYSMSATGTHALPAEFLAAWGTAGWEQGPLGYPTTDVTTTPDGAGRYVHFQGGSVYWTRPTGAHVLRGVVRDAWAAAGWERSALGYPTTDVVVTPDGKGQYSYFQGGAVYWSQATGAHVLRGPVLDAWTRTGWEQGSLGYPTRDVTVPPDGTGSFAYFQNGAVYWSPATGAHVLRGPVLDAWGANGWERGALGYPTTDVTVPPDGKGAFAHFEGGSIYWSPTTGAHALRGAVLQAWAGTGWEKGRLGYPTSDAQRVSGGTRTDFQRGYITVSDGTGVATVHVN
jgi:uncharacterized protein with LGFP repeats